MRHEPLDAARLAAIGRNQIREIRMPTHPAHIAAQSHQFGLQLGPDKGTDLESLMIQRAGARVLEIPGRCGFAQFAPRGAKQIIGLVEVHVILLAEIAHHIGVTVQPVENHLNISSIQGLRGKEAGVIKTILPIERHHAIERHRHGIQHHVHL